MHDSALLTFKGVVGFGVYNCSVPFKHKGKVHIYGRIERREEWAELRVLLFEQTGKDEFTAVPELTLELEDPSVSHVAQQMFFGTKVIESGGDVSNYFCD
jgi:beta-1,2-mannooligosaccharide synthase